MQLLPLEKKYRVLVKGSSEELIDTCTEILCLRDRKAGGLGTEQSLEKWGVSQQRGEGAGPLYMHMQRTTAIPTCVPDWACRLCAGTVQETNTL